MLNIIANLKFCYKFFQEEDFSSVSDCEFARFERSLELTQDLLERQKQNLICALLSSSECAVKNRIRKSLDSLDALCELLSGFWEQNLDKDFSSRLDSLAESFA